jgi:hypothetical protein
MRLATILPENSDAWHEILVFSFSNPNSLIGHNAEVFCAKATKSPIKSEKPRHQSSAEMVLADAPRPM